MSDHGELMLEILKNVQNGVSDLQKGQRRIEQRLTSFERQQAGDRYDATLFREDFDALKDRVERMERRLDLHDPTH